MQSFTITSPSKALLWNPAKISWSWRGFRHQFTSNGDWKKTAMDPYWPHSEKMTRDSHTNRTCIRPQILFQGWAWHQVATEYPSCSTSETPGRIWWQKKQLGGKRCKKMKKDFKIQGEKRIDVNFSVPFLLWGGPFLEASGFNPASSTSLMRRLGLSRSQNARWRPTDHLTSQPSKNIGCWRPSTVSFPVPSQPSSLSLSQSSKRLQSWRSFTSHSWMSFHAPEPSLGFR